MLIMNYVKKVTSKINLTAVSWKKLKLKLNNFIIDCYWDIRSLREKLTFRKIKNSVCDRFDAVFFCLMLLCVGIISPKQLRTLMIDALTDQKKSK